MVWCRPGVHAWLGVGLGLHAWFGVGLGDSCFVLCRPGGFMLGLV